VVGLGLSLIREDRWEWGLSSRTGCSNSDKRHESQLDGGLEGRGVRSNLWRDSNVTFLSFTLDREGSHGKIKKKWSAKNNRS